MSYADLISELNATPDPGELLGDEHEADDEAVKAVFERLCASADDVKKRKLQDAFRRMSSEHRRLRARLLAPRPLDHARQLKDYIRAKPRYAGPGAWLRTLRELAGSAESRENLTTGDVI